MRVFTTSEAAKICNVSPRTLTKWIDTGQLKGYRLPGTAHRRVPREYLLTFMVEHGLPTDELPPEFSTCRPTGEKS